MKIFLLLLLFTAHATAKELQINSSPDKAEVYISTLKSNEFRKAGATSFKMGLDEISSSYANGDDIFVVEVRMDGFETYRIILPKFLRSDISLDVLLTQRSDWENNLVVDKAVADLFEAQRMIRAQNYEGALKKIEEVEKKMPKLSVTKELIGSAHYMKTDYVKALDYYHQAFAANTQNTDAYKMIVYLEKALGIKNAKDAGGKKQ